MGSIHLPDQFDSVFSYGKVVSVGLGVTREQAKVDFGEGDYVVFDPTGQRELLLDPHKDKDEGLVALHCSQVFSTITKPELEARKLPLV